MTSMLDGPRARGAFLIRSVLNPPFSLRIADQAPLCLVTMVRGEAWMMPDGGEPILLHPGDVTIIRGPDPYTIANDPATPISAIIQPGQRCTSFTGDDLAESMHLGVRSWGDSLDGSTVMLSGTYQMTSEIGQRLLGALPPLLVQRAEEQDNPIISLLVSEMGKSEPGQELVLDRLLDLLMITVVRAWLADPDSGAPAWYRAQHDNVVGPALRLMHNNPELDWTVQKLAAQIGVSRAALAKRFTLLVGEPPMMYLTRWRLTLAADLLCEPDATVSAVAHRVGYANSFALSAAFKRVRGVSPQEHRSTILGGSRQPLLPRQESLAAATV